MSLRIAYIFDRPLPSTETDSEQAVRTVAALSRRGLDVELVVPRPLSGESTAEELQAYYGVHEPIRVRTLASPLGFFSPGRKWWHAIQAAALDADVYYTRNFPALFYLAAHDRPTVYETYRPWFDQFPILERPFRAAMSQACFLGAVLHSYYARDRYRELGVEDDRLTVAHNGCDPALFAHRPSMAEARASLGLPHDRPIVTYTGHVNATKGLDVVLSIARRCPEALFLLVGSTGEGVIELLARSIPNVQVLPWQRFERVVHYLAASDVLLQPPSDLGLRVVGNTVLPMKLFMYLAAGRPILGPSTPDVLEVLRDGHNAALVPCNEPEIAARQLRGLLADEPRRRRLGEAAALTARGLTWDSRARRIEGFLERRLSSTSRAPLSLVPARRTTAPASTAA